MPVNLSLKNVPDDVADRLRERARRNHRSLQGELMAIMEAAVAERERLSPRQVLERVQALGLASTSDSVEIVRQMRDGRNQGR